MKRCEVILKKTVKLAATAAVVAALLPAAMCAVAVWGMCAGGGDIKSH